MDTRPLQKIDLNLLVALQILLEERNVSRAAERLHITQPAMSKTLSRLRDVFDDPLFTRNQGSMQPTPRALDLERDLPAALGGLTQLVSGPGFEPASYKGEIVLALSEYVGLALLPPLIRRIQLQAPKLSVRIITRVENQLEQLANGNLDFAIQIAQARYAEAFHTRFLGAAPPIIMVRKNHPLTRGEITWERLAQYPIIRLYISDIDQSELAQNSEVLARINNPDQASLEISHLMTALEVMRSSDYFLPGSLFMMTHQLASSDMVTLPMPRESRETMKYMLVMHERCSSSPLHRWVWERIVETVEEIRQSSF